VIGMSGAGLLEAVELLDFHEEALVICKERFSVSEDCPDLMRRPADEREIVVKEVAYEREWRRGGVAVFTKRATSAGQG
jgi:hypothetical protein